MKNALILTYSGFQDQEVVYPYYRLLGDGFKVDIVADKKDAQGRFYGILGVNMPCTVLYDEFKQENSRFEIDYDFLVLPGGVKSLEKLRQIQEVLDFITKWNENKKIIASTCHGAQLLISSKIVKGRDITGYPSLKDDLVNAGANYKLNPVVVDNNIVSSPHYDFMGEWMETAIKQYYLHKS
jgi:protease I